MVAARCKHSPGDNYQRESQPPLAQWANILWLGNVNPEVNNIALLYAAYFDASGKKKKKYPVLSVAGGVAPVKKWCRFEKEWNVVLKRFGVSEFHATDLACAQGEYEGWDADKRSNFLNDLVPILRRNVNKFFSVSCELAPWDDVNREYLLEECLYSPYAFCSFAVVKQVLDWAKRKRISKNNIKFIFERGDPGWGGVLKLCEHLDIHPIDLPKSEAKPCQVGDWVAWKSRIAYSNATLKFDEFIVAPIPSVKDFLALVAEGESLNKAMVCPGKTGVFSRKALLENCSKLGIPRRPIKP